jgi:hypothetical protein
VRQTGRHPTQSTPALRPLLLLLMLCRVLQLESLLLLLLLVVVHQVPLLLTSAPAAAEAHFPAHRSCSWQPPAQRQ